MKIYHKEDAILTASDITHSPPWWESVFMMEPLLSLPRAISEVTIDETAETDSDRVYVEQEYGSLAYWFQSWFIYIPW